MAEQVVRLWVSGRVQGVGYRAWARGEAQALGLRGWVRNLPDGRVEAVLGGDQDALAGIEARFHDGPAFARVTGVVTEIAEAALPDGVEIRR